jgi:hypothetical protein
MARRKHFLQDPSGTSWFARVDEKQMPTECQEMPIKCQTTLQTATKKRNGRPYLQRYLDFGRRY